MFSDDQLMTRLALKGGNLLDIVYGIAARSSLDLDFGIHGDFEWDTQTLNARIAAALKRTFSEAGYVAFDVTTKAVPPIVSEDVEDFWGGYQVEFKIIERDKYREFSMDPRALRRNATSVGKRGSTKFRIDLSKREHC